GQGLPHLWLQLARRGERAEPIVVEIDKPDRLLNRLLLDDRDAALAGGRQRERDAIGGGGQLHRLWVWCGQGGAAAARLFEQQLRGWRGGYYPIAGGPADHPADPHHTLGNRRFGDGAALRR